MCNARYVHRREVHKYLLNMRPADFVAEEARKGLTPSPEERVILCEEALCGNMHTGEHHGFLTKGLAERLKETFPHAEIVLFLRRQTDIIASSYRLYVREGGNYSLDRYLYGAFNHWAYPEFSLDHFNYYQMVRLYQSLFGKKHVHVFLYEDFARNNHAFLRDYARILKLEVDSDSLELRRANKGYSNFLLRLKWFLNFFTNRGTSQSYCLLQLYNSKKIPRYILAFWGWFEDQWNACFKKEIDEHTENLKLLGPKNVTTILEHYRASNQQLEKELNLPLKSYGYC